MKHSTIVARYECPGPDEGYETDFDLHISLPEMEPVQIDLTNDNDINIVETGAPEDW